MFVSKNEMEQHRTNHADRYNGIEDSIPGTRSYHQFVPLSRDRVGAKRCSDDEQFACTHDFNAVFCLDEEILVGSYVAVIYDQSWWVGLIIEKNDEESDVKVKFMHPKGPSMFYHWPQRDDFCYIPFNCILKIIDVPMSTGTGRNYSIKEEESIVQKCNIFMKNQ